ncbi:DNA polymerase III subunit beta [Sporosarcina pasteurii]|uniref:Beta sliding clamp n=1 Tax=Sporosarcina pasteurii TaxID=1474 RepID=A0A380BAA1_SPOPA|nr:DNA polymerase III subunit beta [Sporosarcina pasteurii]MDS9471828.1 DNA polymerase III subunit beta [Sporosarcina pasteurii]QBQ06567.1 DNA polymerase III subunit beta [Sporosarcina pasteurii]SUI97993.1 DNA polymerase III subunit beta [Sporosarcina pasteurii]
MKFEIVRDELLDALNDVMKAISSKVAIPILTGIKIEVNENGMSMTGSDSDITIRTFIPVERDGKELIKISEQGSIVLQARVFSEIIRKLPTNEVKINVTDGLLTLIHSGKSEFKLIGSNPDEYPILPEVKDEHSFSLPADLMKSIIRETVFAVSQQETRPILTGVHWTVEEGKLSCVATDSHRLARKLASPENMPTIPFSFVIPGKSLQELNKILPDSDSPVKIIIAEQQVLFKTDHVLFYSRLLEGNYPDTSRLIPTESKTSVTVNGRALLQSIDRASLLAKEDRNNIVRFSTEDKMIEISSNSPEIGKVEELVEAIQITGEELKISFSAKYMMDALRAIDGQDIEIQFTGAMRPFILKSADDDSILQLILPVRTY